MAWIEPKFSKKNVSRAGDILLDNSLSEEQHSEAMLVLNNWRSSHAFPLRNVQTFLRKKASEIDKHALIAQRLKRVPSILEKLRRFHTMRLHRMQDIGGCRAVVADVKKVYKLRDDIVNSRTRHELIKENDYINQPKESGYRSIHLVYKYRSSKTIIYNDLMIEIQIRTRLQHAWATTVEIVGTFLRESLKSSQGPEEWLHFFKLISVLFSDLEDCKPKEIVEEIENIRAEARKLADNLCVIEKLQAFSVSTHHIGKQNKNSGYFLLSLRTDKRTIQVDHYNKHDLVVATNLYLELEKEYENNINADVVLVAATSIKSLRVAYPNYFADSRVFLERLKDVLRLTDDANKRLHPGQTHLKIDEMVERVWRHGIRSGDGVASERVWHQNVEWEKHVVVMST